MSELSRLDCRTELLLYDARRIEFLKNLMVRIKRLKAQVETCDKYLKNKELGEHREARIKLTSMEGEVQNLVLRFLNSRNDQNNSIKQLFNEPYDQMPANKKSELSYFVNLKNDIAEEMVDDMLEADSLITEFVNFLKELTTARTTWYSEDPNDQEQNEAAALTDKFHKFHFHEGNED